MVRILSTFLILLLFALPVYAQDVLTVRAGVHPEYNRLVFDWDSLPGYGVEQDGNQITMIFDEAAAVDLTNIQNRDLDNITNIQKLSANGEPLAIRFSIPDGSRYRDFSIGSRVIVDIYNPPGRTMVAREDPRPEPAPDSRPEPQRQPAPEPQKSEAEEEPESQEVVEAAEDVMPPPPEVTEVIEEAELDPLALEPHVITISVTRSVGMAVFERAGWYWIVLDDPNLPVPPEVSGPQKDLIPPMERMEIPGGLAYRARLPFGANLYGEGGGLLWRVVMTPSERERDPVEPERKFDGTSRMRGGTLVWPLSNTRKILEMRDPVVGDIIQAVTVSTSDQYAGPEREFPELVSLTSPIGLAITGKVDDVSIERTAEGVAVTRPQGLVLSRPEDIVPIKIREEIDRRPDDESEEGEEDQPGIYNFTGWQMGGTQALMENEQILMTDLAAKEGSDRVEDLITLAKLNLANTRGHEAIGYLRVANQFLPGINESAEFIAMRGAARALAGKHDEAIEDFVSPKLQDFEEIGYWKAATLAGLEDWQQAIDVMPVNFDKLADYPTSVRNPVALYLTEVALRAGRIPLAEGLLALLESDLENMPLHQRSNWNYLTGEAQRQLGNTEEAVTYWEPLTEGQDDYFRAKAGLALTRLQLEKEMITPAQAIDRLEGLRYAWRGDELETLINYRLGQVYVANDNYLKGLSVLRNAAGLSPGSALSTEITNYMTDSFQSLFTDGKLSDVSPIEAVSIYDEFQELTPAGADGDKFVEALAERLVEVDLLGRAADLLENQVQFRLEGQEAARVATRLAAIRLLDNKPEAALRALDVAEEELRATTEGGVIPQENRRELALLRARALSKLNKPDEALTLLSNIEPDRDLNRLKADVAWNSGRWGDAAEAIRDLIIEEDISPSRPLTPAQADLILNRAIALNLAGNRVAIASLRERYEQAMSQTEKAQLFDLVTRPRRMGLLGNRESVGSLVSEVDLFGEFLESYRQSGSNQPSN